jgi:hypothetical protein
MLDEHAGALVEQILAPDRGLDLAGGWRYGLIGSKGRSGSFIHEAINIMRVIRI